MELAPIVLFVYDRLLHTTKTIESLQRNKLSIDTEIYIYCDGPKNKKSIKPVENVRRYVKNITGFKKLTIINQNENLGLANSIISGVTEIINRHGKAIVMEDDLVVSPYFIKFMNESLDFYEFEKDVWHISGWNYPMSVELAEDTYFYRIMDCWGWATWSNRWKYFQKNTDELINNMSTKDIDKFNLDGCTSLWRQVELNFSGRIDTWAIYWYATIFNHNGLCLNPVISYVENIGNDGSGVHCTISSGRDNVELNEQHQIIFEKNIAENSFMVSKIKIFFKANKKSFLIRLWGRVHSLVKKHIL